jgi:hypothetical protein
MDDELVTALQSPVVAATLQGQGWIDEVYEPGSREHRYYSGLCLLHKLNQQAWWTYIQFYEMPDMRLDVPIRVVNSKRVRRMEARIKQILQDLDIEETLIL